MFRWACALALIGCLAGCESRKAGAIGGNEQIIVFADSSQWYICLPAMLSTFERTFRVPQPEQEFYIQLVPLSVFESYKHYKNIVFLGSLESQEPVALTVQGMLGSDVRPGVESGKYFLFVRDDEWSRGQKIMILTATSPPVLASTIEEHRDELFGIFEDHKTELMRQALFGQDNPLEDKALIVSLYEKYGWTMRLYPDFKLVDESSDGGYVRFHAFSRHSSMQKWISVWWTTTTQPDTLMPPPVLSRLRNHIGSLFVDPTTTVPAYDHFEGTVFAGYPSTSYRGVWRTTTLDNAFGGAFRAYAFFDSTSHRFFMVDQSVFFPEDKKKLQFLRELDIITHTFTTHRP